MEFRGIVNLTTYTAHQLELNLAHKESELARHIIDSLNASSLFKPKESDLKLGTAVTFFNKQVRILSLNKKFTLTKKTFDSIVSNLDAAFWNYLEILENSITELFLQIKLIGIERFEPGTAEAIDSIKMTLMHHLDDLAFAIKNLEPQLKKLRRSIKGASFLDSLQTHIPYFNSCLDRRIILNLQKSRKFLSFNYQKFHQDYLNYKTLADEVMKKNVKFVGFPVLNRLDADSKQLFIKNYDLLKLLEVNHKLKLIPENDITETLKALNDSKRVSHIFEEYQNALSREAFEKSRMLKFYPRNSLNDEFVKTHLMDSLFVSLKEVHLLGSAITHYRDFLLKTDQDPYVSSRWGFHEWIVGREPPLTKNLKSLSYDVEETNHNFEKLIYAVQMTKHHTVDLEEVKKRCDLDLHEMAQPLISVSSMKHYAEKILREIEKLNEFETFDFQVVDFIGIMLIKLLKHDWKYHVLFTLPEFEKVYETHIGIMDKEHENRLHLNRITEFMRLGREIKELIKTKTTHKDEEIAFLINDIKGRLQDFLGTVQHLSPKQVDFSEKYRDICFQLLEYRYFFGKYFHELEQLERNGQSVRTQLMFVDQYLDVVDELLAKVER